MQTTSRSFIQAIGACVGFLILLFAGGCEGDSGDTVDRASPPPPSEDAVSQEVVIKANDQMRYDTSEFTVTAGSVVKLTLRNVGSMPAASMGHNVVIMVPGADILAFAAASSTEAVNGYVAPAYEASIVTHTAMTGGGESDSVVFEVPSKPGDYPFLCSFPGHVQAGMKGTMHVTR